MLEINHLSSPNFGVLKKEENFLFVCAAIILSVGRREVGLLVQAGSGLADQQEATTSENNLTPHENCIKDVLPEHILISNAR